MGEGKEDVEQHATVPRYCVVSRFKSLNNTGRKGGFRATSFLYGLVALENMGFIANMVSMVLYFILSLNFDISGAANTLTNLMGSTFILSIVGGFISDTYLDRLHTCLIFGSIEILALALMTVQAYYPSLHPKRCGESSCMEGGIGVLFYTSLSLLALGTGGVRGALPALGADQFDQKKPKELKALGSYFNWFLLSTTLGACVGVTGIVWVSTNKGWWYGFFIATLGSTVGYFVLFLGKPFYRLQVPGDGPITRICQVIVAAFKNRKLSHPDSPEQLYELSEKESAYLEARVLHTEQFRWLDRAAIIRDDDLIEGKQATRWELCTVTQIEEVKVLTRMLPIIGSTIIMNTCLAQLQTFSIAQGNYMNLLLGNFKVPAASIPVIPLVFMSILLPIYEIFFVPFIRKITKHPSGITQLQRVGVGLVLSAISMGVAGLVEVKRRNQSRINPLEPISLFWLSFQFGIFGIADMFTLVGLLEFFYKEAPVGLRSLSTSFTWVSLSLGYFLSSVLVEIINSVTQRVTPSKQGWLHGKSLDQINLNLFYWFLAILSCINFINYLFWASWYKYKSVDINTVEAEEVVSDNGSLPMVSATQDDLSKTATSEEKNIAIPTNEASSLEQNEASSLEQNENKIKDHEEDQKVDETIATQSQIQN